METEAWGLPTAPLAAQLAAHSHERAPAASSAGDLLGPSAPPEGVLSKASKPHTVAREQPPHLLAPFLYEVDGHRFIVDALQGQS